TCAIVERFVEPTGFFESSCEIRVRLCSGALGAGALELFDRPLRVRDRFVEVAAPLLDQAQVEEAGPDLLSAADALGEGEPPQSDLCRRFELPDVPIRQAQDAQARRQRSQVAPCFGEPFRLDAAFTRL